MSDAPSVPATRTMTPKSGAAARMARHRDRRRKGLICVMVEVRSTEANFLVRGGYLSSKGRIDPVALRNALHAWFDDVFA
jgi:hypothetical protein